MKRFVPPTTCLACEGALRPIRLIDHDHFGFHNATEFEYREGTDPEERHLVRSLACSDCRLIFMYALPPEA